MLHTGGPGSIISTIDSLEHHQKWSLSTDTGIMSEHCWEWLPPLTKNFKKLIMKQTVNTWTTMSVVILKMLTKSSTVEWIK